jgi:hypothetical protein
MRPQIWLHGFSQKTSLLESLTVRAMPDIYIAIIMPICLENIVSVWGVGVQ